MKRSKFTEEQTMGYCGKLRQELALPICAVHLGWHLLQMAQRVMLACSEKWFGNVKTSSVEGFRDNGSCYPARETITFAATQGIVSKLAPARPPNATEWLKLSSKHSNEIMSSVLIGQLRNRDDADSWLV